MTNNQTKSSLNMVLRDYYLDWVNNWISVESFATYHELTQEQALEVIALGRSIHETYCETLKEMN